MTPIPSSVVVWRGPSALDGSPIRVVVTGLRSGSSNRKTGSMAQVWILRDDMDALAAMRSGEDAAVCGSCPLRGTVGPDGRRIGRACYVNVGQAPQSITRADGRGSYVDVDASTVGEWLTGRAVRLGAYGDPAAAPIGVMRALVAHARLWTGYSHQWREISPEWSDLVMASCETAEDRDRARAMGYRTFRVMPADGNGEDMDREIVCPSETRGTHCEDCGACSGTTNGTRSGRVSVTITAHGTGKRYV